MSATKSRQRTQGKAYYRLVHGRGCANYSAVNRPRDAVNAMIKRLAHKNANVQLYTLEVGHSLE